MMPLHLAWILSLTGAILFFAAGVLVARRSDAAAALPAESPRADFAAQSTAIDDGGLALEDQVTKLHGQVASLRGALRDAGALGPDERRELERYRGERGAAAETARREVSIELAVAQQRLAELETVRRENGTLRAAAADCEKLRAELAATARELREARARGRVSTAPPPPTPVARLPRGPRGTEPQCTSEALNGLLIRMRATKGMRAVALADDLGLPIVGAGDDISSLAAFSALVTDIGKKTCDFLPFGKLRRLTLEDEQDSTITACPFETGGARIALVTLTVGPGPSPRQVGEVLRSAASMIQ
jgi:predicted regulator of Ras-like GTPase activity (Roadblock/LC7/MglB family)